VLQETLGSCGTGREGPRERCLAFVTPPESERRLHGWTILPLFFLIPFLNHGPRLNELQPLPFFLLHLCSSWFISYILSDFGFLDALLYQTIFFAYLCTALFTMNDSSCWFVKIIHCISFFLHILDWLVGSWLLLHCDLQEDTAEWYIMVPALLPIQCVQVLSSVLQAAGKRLF
jgi:hypothetical protein